MCSSNVVMRRALPILQLTQCCKNLPIKATWRSPTFRLIEEDRLWKLERQPISPPRRWSHGTSFVPQSFIDHPWCLSRGSRKHLRHQTLKPASEKRSDHVPDPPKNSLIFGPFLLDLRDGNTSLVWPHPRVDVDVLCPDEEGPVRREGEPTIDLPDEVEADDQW